METTMLQKELFFEDFHIGQKFSIRFPATVRVTAEEIKEFGTKYDPQPFHLDEAAGEGSFFKGLAASGWLTAAIVMRLRVGVAAGVWRDDWRGRGRDALDGAGCGRTTPSARKSKLWASAILLCPPQLRHRADPHPYLQPEQPGRAAQHRQLPGADPRFRPGFIMSDEDLSLLKASEDRIVALELTSGEQFFAEIVMVVDEAAQRPDVFLLRLNREPDGAFVATSTAGESHLLADIARVAEIPGLPT